LLALEIFIAMHKIIAFTNCSR